jgi:hypothetical protein
MTDYTPITEQIYDSVAQGEEDERRLSFGEWWKQPPHAIRKVVYAPYRGEHLPSVRSSADALVPIGNREIRYTPTNQKGLLGAFLEVAQNRATPVSFVNRFGLLGYNFLVPEQNKCKEGGDPIPWFLAHARTVYVLASLTNLIKSIKERSEARKKLATYLAELPLGPYAQGGRVIKMDLSTRSSKPLLSALGIIRTLTNPNLGDTGYRIQWTARGLNNFFSFQALIQVIYWQLAHEFDSRLIIRCCECGRIFVSHNPRTQFCLPEGAKKISPCKSKWNTRNTRRRQRRGDERKLQPPRRTRPVAEGQI